MQEISTYEPKELSRGALIELLNNTKLVKAISTYKTEPITNFNIDIKKLKSFQTLKYDFMEIMKTHSTLLCGNELEQYLQAFEEYKKYTDFNTMPEYPIGCEKEHSGFKDAFLSTIDVLNDLIGIPFNIKTETLYNKAQIKWFLNTFGEEMIGESAYTILTLDEDEEIDIEDSFYHEYISDRIASESTFPSKNIYFTRGNTSYSYDLNDSNLERFCLLNPGYYELGITYFYSKEIDNFLESINIQNEKSSNLEENFRNKFNVFTSRLSRDTIAHSSIRIIDNSNPFFPTDTNSKYVLMCGYTTAGYKVARESMTIENSTFIPIDWPFLSNVMISLKGIKKILKNNQ